MTESFTHTTKTPAGEITVEQKLDGDYPGYYVLINGVPLVMVEFDKTNQEHAVRVWNHQTPDDECEYHQKLPEGFERDIRRIDPQEVIDAMKAKNLKAKRGSYFSEANNTCACGLGAIYAETSNVDFTKFTLEYSPQISGYVDNIYGESYTRGFALGFDGEEVDDIYVSNPTRLHEGYADGEAAWEAVLEAGLEYREDEA